MPKMTHSRLVTILSVLIALQSAQTFHAQPVWAEGKENAVQIDELEQALRQLQGYLKELQSRVTVDNQFNMPGPATPDAVIDIIGEVEKFLRKAPANELRQSSLYQDIYAEAILLLYKGRGSSKDARHEGWYPVRKKGETGKLHLEELINAGKLDAEGKKHVLREIENFNFDDGQARISRGFPPEGFPIGSLDNRNEAMSLVHNAPTAKDYKPLSQFKQGALTVAELIQESKASGGEKEAAHSILGVVDTNLYDKSIAIVNDPNASFIDYYGRDHEVARILDTLSRLEKGHVLITGKAGVGKTTILRMLQDGFVTGKYAIRNEPAPIILELSITDVTNKEDPTIIKKRIAAAQLLAKVTDRRVILYVDEGHISSPMVRNAIKSHLSQKISKEENQVHFIISTTSAEARDFLSDTAFSRRFVDVFAREFDKAETIELIKVSFLKQWRKHHQFDGMTFENITDEAFDYAYRNALSENKHSGNPTGTKELLEGAITRLLRLRKKTKHVGPITLGVQEVRDYIRDMLEIDLLPGDPEFDTRFNLKWEAFAKDYVGSPGFMHQLKKIVRRHFATMTEEERKMTAFVVFGAPGAGKTFLNEMLVKHFFRNGKSALLTISGADLKNGGLELNKLLGSPPGTVGSEQQRSMLTRHLSDNPQGGMIAIEEGDYMHQDAIQLFTNMITSSAFTDGLGKEWRVRRMILAMTSNIGQELMLPPDRKNKMTWEQYETRRSQILEKVEIDGVMVERVKEHVLQEVFQRFIETIVTKSHPGADTSGVAQEAAKQMRRYIPLYLLPPNKEELIEAAHTKVKNYLQRAFIEAGVKFMLSKQEVEEILAIDNYDFEKGYSYVQEQLDAKLFDILTMYLDRRGETIAVKLEKDLTDPARPRQALLVTAGDHTERHEIVYAVSQNKNPWASSDVMVKRIMNFPQRMRVGLKGHNKSIEYLQKRLKKKMLNWDTQIVVTKAGTSGNGKTAFALQTAIALFDDPRALVTVAGMDSKFQLNNHFRPPMGIQGGTQETETERQIEARRRAGGGVMLLDELLSLAGLDSRGVADRIEVISALYQLLDTGFMMIGNRLVDMRSFVIVITGNAFQEYFAGIPDDPSADGMIQKLLGKITQTEINEYFKKFGIDAPKVARFGYIDISGPLTRAESTEAAKVMLQKEIKAVRADLGNDVEVVVDPALIDAITKRVKTLKLGMRKVNEAFRQLVADPMASLSLDLPGIRKIEIRLDNTGHILWFVNGEEVVLQGTAVDDSGLMSYTWVFGQGKRSGTVNGIPQLQNVEEAPRVVLSEENVRATAVHEVKGHWAVHVLLSGKNPTDAISVIPAENWLGYVMPKEKKEHSLVSLSPLLAEMAALQAGHRSVFVISQLYADGGGTLDTSAKDRNDDIAKVKRSITAIINNQMLSGYSEFSSAASKGALYQMLNRLSGLMADYLVSKAHLSKAFDAIEQKVIAERYVSAPALDEAVSKMDWNVLGGPQQNLLESVLYASDTYLNERRIPKRERLVIQNIVARVKNELLRKTAPEAATHAKIQTIIADHEAGKLAYPFPTLDSCEIAFAGAKKNKSEK